MIWLPRAYVPAFSVIVSPFSSCASAVFSSVTLLTVASAANVGVAPTTPTTTAASGTYEQTLRSEMAKSEPPTLFQVNGPVGLGNWKDAFALLRRYEAQFLRLPEDDAFRNRTLGLIYHSWGDALALMSTVDDHYDFVDYYAKMAAYLTKAPLEPDQYADMPIGMWASLVGTARKGALQEYVDVAGRGARHISRCWNSGAGRMDTLCRAELLFYQGDTRAAAPVFAELLQWASAGRRFEIENKALFYLMRLAFMQNEAVNLVMEGNRPEDVATTAL